MEEKLEELLEELDHEGEGKIDIVDFVTYVIKNELKLNNWKKCQNSLENMVKIISKDSKII